MRKPKTKRDWALYRAILETELGLNKIEDKENINESIYCLLQAINSIANAMYTEIKRG
jgi:hypothetical protein